ncbi:hypothetical protein ASG81_09200 [Paenibacillus sp. Soil522]|nr:hypothetical protein ASG81_09200 [Paenibacillus sp. Soil522]
MDSSGTIYELTASIVIVAANMLYNVWLLLLCAIRMLRAGSVIKTGSLENISATIRTSEYSDFSMCE